MFQNFWRLPLVALYSNLDLDTTSQRLQAAVDPDKISVGTRHAKTVLGTVSGTEFRIRKRWAWFYDGQMGEYFSGTVQQLHVGIRIQGRYEMLQPFRLVGLLVLAIFSAMGIAVVALFGVAFVRGKLVGWVFTATCLGWVVLWPLWIRFLQYVWRVRAQKHETYLIEFLKTTLAASEAPTVTDARAKR